MAENYNVLLVALSTFQKVDGKDRVTLSKYHYKGDNSRGKYYYQMEPVLEILGNTLKKAV
jgi:hypothetical protein